MQLINQTNYAQILRNCNSLDCILRLQVLVMFSTLAALLQFYQLDKELFFNLIQQRWLIFFFASCSLCKFDELGHMQIKRRLGFPV